MEKDLIIIGCNGYVSAIHTSNGQEIWRTKLHNNILGGSRGSDVSVLIDGNQIYAGCNGRIYALKTSDGNILWSNDLKGMGYNEVSITKQGISTQFITRAAPPQTSSSQ